MSQKFPNGFLWGASTAAYQVEGGITNDWSQWEPTVADNLAQTAEKRLKGVVPNWGAVKHKAQNPDNYISGSAASHYQKFEQDVALMNELSLSAYRFSIEWARVQPRADEFDDEVIAHYKRALSLLRENNITPLLCLHHFTNPAWIADISGWHDPRTVAHYLNYVEKITEELGSLCDIWFTFNEPNAFALSRYLGGGIWPDWSDATTNPYRMVKAVRNMAKAHKQARSIIKRYNPSAKVGIDHGHIVTKAINSNPLSKLIAKVLAYLSNDFFPNMINGHEDVLGTHYYVRVDVHVGLSGPAKWADHHDSDAKTDMGWGIYPRGIYEVTQKLKTKDLPIYITENGLADSRDELRRQFIHDHLEWLQKSVADGADVRGYCHWSLLDNFEWSEGFWPQFGLISYDNQTFERTIKDSARYYAQITKENKVIPLEG
jgi:beta-glucosidase